MTDLLNVSDLHKRFKDTHAVRGLTFTIPKGICLGLLGPNGAGKTTTIEMLEGIKLPSSGKIEYLGKPLKGALLAEYKAKIGIQFQSTALMDFLTVKEVLTLFGGFYKNSLSIESLIELCDLEEFQHSQANKVSGGQKQRLLLAMALVNDPEIIFLDEPTTGLDPQSRRNFWSLIENIKTKGKTVVLTTHYMDEAEILCDELLIIDHGNIIAQGSPKALLSKHFNQQYIELNKAPLIGIPTELGDLEEHNKGITIQTNKPNELIAWFIKNNTDLAGLQIKNPTLEDLFIKLTGHTLRD